MSLSVFLVVLLAACLHATWNSLVKGSADKYVTMLAVVLGHLPAALLALPFTPAIDPASLPWLIASVLLHLGYQLFLVAGYRIGDLTLVYPLARGSAPVFVTVISIGLLGISFTYTELSGVAFIVLGLISLCLVRRESGMRNTRAVVLALCTGAFIAAYSLVDGIGARLATTAPGYWSWAAIGNAIGFGLWTALTRPTAFTALTSNRSTICTGLLGGIASFLAYGIVIWAFTQAPIALVTALRETSIAFALVIGVIVLKERINLAKLIATMLTIGGAILLRVAKP